KKNYVLAKRRRRRGEQDRQELHGPEGALRKGAARGTADGAGDRERTASWHAHRGGAVAAVLLAACSPGRDRRRGDRPGGPRLHARGAGAGSSRALAHIAR